MPELVKVYSKPNKKFLILRGKHTKSGGTELGVMGSDC